MFDPVHLLGQVMVPAPGTSLLAGNLGWTARRWLYDVRRIDGRTAASQNWRGSNGGVTATSLNWRGDELGDVLRGLRNVWVICLDMLLRPTMSAGRAGQAGSEPDTLQISQRNSLDECFESLAPVRLILVRFDGCIFRG